MNEECEMNPELSVESILAKLQELYKEGQEQLLDELVDYFTSFAKAGDNPFCLALDLVQLSNTQHHDLNNAGTKNLPYIIIQQLCVFLREPTGEAVTDSYLSKEVRLRAFRLIFAYKQNQIVNVACEAFGFRDHAAELVDELKRLIAGCKFLEAAKLAVALGLEAHVVAQSRLLIPLALTHNFDLIVSLTVGNEARRKQVVRQLDDLCANPENLARLAHEFHVSQVLKVHHTSKKSVETTIKKMLDIPAFAEVVSAEDAPSMKQNTHDGFLFHLIYQHFAQKKIEYLILRDMIEYEVDHGNQKPLPLINILVGRKFSRFYDIIPLAAYFASYCNVSEDLLPPRLLPYMHSPAAKADMERLEAEPEYNCNDYYNLSIPLDQVIMVDTKEKVQRALAEIVKYERIGVDTESVISPTPTQSGKPPADLLQVAVEDRVYIFDLLTLRSVDVGVELWQELCSQLFDNEQLLVLGHGFGDGDGDLRCIAAAMTLVDKSLSKLVLSNTICLKRLVNALFQEDMRLVEGHVEPSLISLQKLKQTAEEEGAANGECAVTVAPERTKQNMGLTNMCECFLGKPLDKTLTKCNWAKRPLRKATLIYAAADAHCQLELLDKIVKKAKSLGIDVEKVLKQVKTQSSATTVAQKQQTPSKVKPGEMRDAATPSKNEFVEQVLPLVDRITATLKAEQKARGVASMRLLVDFMLMPLCKNLRRLGIDTESVAQNTSIPQTVKLALSSGRVLVSKGKAAVELKDQLPEDRLCVLASGSTHLSWQDDLGCTLLSLGIAVERADIGSRCVRCNSRDFMVLPQLAMRHLHNALHSHHASQAKPAPLCTLTDGDYQAEDVGMRGANLVPWNNRIMNVKEGQIRWENRNVKFSFENFGIVCSKLDDKVYFVCLHCGGRNS